MSEPIETTDSPVVEPVDEDTADLDPRSREILTKLKKENHSLRTRLRSTEDDLGIAAARLNSHHRSVIEAAAKAAGLIDGSDFWAAHPDPAAFLDEQFNDVIGDKVTAATKALIASKPYLSRPVGRPPSDRPIESLRSGATPLEEPKSVPSWHTALRGG